MAIPFTAWRGPVTPPNLPGVQVRFAVPWIALASASALLLVLVLPVQPRAAAASAPACARTTTTVISGSNITEPPGGSGSAVPGANTPGTSVAAPGRPCWVDVEPYPFGFDGNPVDTSSPDCESLPPGPGWGGDRLACYLRVDSFAFRSWNRGLASVSPPGSSTTAFGVWLFNGTRWYPDPAFPGQSVCRGNRVLWAGKRDYWLVGSRLNNWSPLCRFDGVNFEWQPLEVPQQTLDHVPLGPDGKPLPGAVNTGACFAWNDCWFLGSFGVVLHWDGSALVDASPDLLSQPWLRTDYLDAILRTDTAGAPVALAAGTSGGLRQGEQLPTQPDGSAPPQLFGSSAGAFSGLPFAAPTSPMAGDPFRTDLVAVDVDSNRRGWVAGNPVGYRADSDPSFLADGRRTRERQPAPLVHVAEDGTSVGCAGAPPSLFTYANLLDGKDSFLWSTVGAFPTGDFALAGGSMRPASRGTNLNDDGSREPVLIAAGCGNAPRMTRFQTPDPWVADQAAADPIPADHGGSVTDVAANAANDAWAGTTNGSVIDPAHPQQTQTQRPHLYRYTDTATPQAPAGDDAEDRPVFFVPDPPIIVEAPPDPDPLPPEPATVTQQRRVTKKRKVKPAIYHVKAKLQTHGRSGLFLVITFRVRRPVSVGAEALRHKKVVSRSGIKRFRGKSGRLVLRLSRQKWPTRVRFVAPKAKKK